MSAAMTIAGRFCAKLIEAGWLLAILVVALFMNPFSERVFEPDKIVLFRSLTLIMLVAWVISMLDDGPGLGVVPSGRDAGGSLRSHAPYPIGSMIRRAIRTPLVLPALLLATAYILSTFTSIAPRMSLGGSYQRLQGTYTTLSYISLFLLILLTLRTQPALERLITVVILTSVPVAVYSILQHYGVALLQFSGAYVDLRARVVSTLGNPIFVAAYIAMAVPVTLWRLLRIVMSPREPYRPFRPGLIALYLGFLALQFMGLVFTQSRGPALALMAELFFFLLFLALMEGHGRLAQGTVGLTVVAVLFLVALNVPAIPMGSIRNLPYLSRLSQMANPQAASEAASSGAGRRLAWQTVLEAMQDQPQRYALGYGPESMILVFNRYMPPELPSIFGVDTFDRAHNQTFDALFTTGILGTAVYLLLVGVLFHNGFSWLGLVTDGRARWLLMALLVGGAILGLVFPIALQGNLVFAGLGIPLGMVGGLTVYVVGLTLRNRPVDPPDKVVHPRLVAALLAAVIGHFLELQVGIAIASTETHFWLYAGLMVLLGTGRIAPAPVATSPPPQPKALRKGPRRGRRDRRPAEDIPVTVSISGLAPLVALSLVMAVLLGCLSYAFLHGFNVPGARAPAIGLILATWLLGGLIVSLEPGQEAGRDTWLVNAAVYAGVSLGWLLPFWLYHQVNAVALDRVMNSFLAFGLWLLLTMAAIAVVLTLETRLPQRLFREDRAIAYPMLMLIALFALWIANITPLRADIYEKIGKTAMEAGLWQQAIPNFQRAVALEPRQDQYYILLGASYVEQARLAPELATQDAWMEQARQVFQRGWELSPTNSDHPRQLGLMYQVWAGLTGDPAIRGQRLQEARKYYQAAVELSPHNPELRIGLGQTYFMLGEYEAARVQFQRAVDLNSPLYLAQAYAGLGDVYTVQGDLGKAGRAYQEAIKRDRQGVLREKIRAVSSNPHDIRLRESLALVYASLGRPGDALKELNAALEMASEAERAEVQRLIRQLKRE